MGNLYICLIFGVTSLGGKKILFLLIENAGHGISCKAGTELKELELGHRY